MGKHKHPILTTSMNRRLIDELAVFQRLSMLPRSLTIRVAIDTFFEVARAGKCCAMCGSLEGPFKPYPFLTGSVVCDGPKHRREIE